MKKAYYIPAVILLYFVSFKTTTAQTFYSCSGTPNPIVSGQSSMLRWIAGGGAQHVTITGGIFDGTAQYGLIDSISTGPLTTTTHYKLVAWNGSSGDSCTGLDIIVNPVGIKSISSTEAESGRITLFNLSGEIVAEYHKGTNETNISNTMGLPKGMYILRFYSDNSRSVSYKKIVLQ